MKREDHVLKIINTISQKQNIKEGKDRHIIPLRKFTEPMTIFLHEGTVAVYRKNDHLLVANIAAPNIIGLNFAVDENDDLYLQARGNIQYEILLRQSVLEVVKQHNLWEHLAIFYMHRLSAFVDNHFVSTGIPTYELVRNNLLALMNEPEAIRSSTSACDYIQEKTMLSRSGIMKMLSDLKKGGHIELKRGVLLEIKSLPSRY